MSSSLFGNEPISPGNPEYPQLVNELFSGLNSGASAFGQSNAEAALEAGNEQEAGAYGNAAAIANANATTALAAGQVEQAQTGLEVRQSIGKQLATQAGSGFGPSASTIGLLQSSTRQGILQGQIVGMNATLEAGGYEEQGASANAEEAAAQGAASSAAALSASENAIGVEQQTIATNEAAALGVTLNGSLSSTSIPNVEAEQPVSMERGMVQMGTNTSGRVSII